ncbi:MAG: glycosyltransferase [Anaerolineales bacterium]|nr:glycosyltransferase [Anaerolineales bacterium]
MLNTSDLEGGAARAVYRLHQGFRSLGIDSQMVVQRSITHQRYIHAPQSKLDRGISALRPSIDQLPQWLFAPSGMTEYSMGWFPDRVASRVWALKPDIVHLNFLGKGFVRPETLPRFHRPLVWTLHDEWAYTGGCYHAGSCERYKASCGVCPKLESRHENDFSRWVWQRKQRAWHNLSITLVCPSRWLAERAGRSSLLSGQDVRVIANGVDLERFKPLDRQTARQWLNLPQEKRLILFSAVRAAQNPYKGFQFLPELLQRLSDLGWQERMELLILGEGDAQDFPEAALPVRWFGHVQDEITVALLNAAVDVLVVPSLQDNLPNTVIEALACGTPCAAFRVGGIPEMLDHQENGYLAALGDASDLAAGVHWILEDPVRYGHLTLQARQTAEGRYDLFQQARQYASLFEELILRQKHA